MTGRAGTRFIVVRHGETRWNVETRIQGQGDSPLTEAGMAQAEAIAARLAREPMDLIVASDLGRALDTARRIAERCSIPIVTDARVRERNFGVAEGLTYGEVEERYPGVFSRVRQSDPDAPIPGGETRRQFHERVRAAFEALVGEQPQRRIAVVTHGGVLAALYRLVHAIPVGAAHRIPIANAAYNAVAFDGVAWSLEAWDDVDHLPGTPPFVES